MTSMLVYTILSMAEVLFYTQRISLCGRIAIMFFYNALDILLIIYDRLGSEFDEMDMT